MTAIHRLTLPPTTLDRAEPPAAAVLAKAKAQVGFIPNMYAYMVNLPGLLETYLDGYARFREGSGLTSAEQEVVFLTISRANGCEYCVAAHSMIADRMSRVPPEVTSAIRAEHPIPDRKLAALSAFTDTMLATRGRPTTAEVRAFLDAGFAERHVLAVILAIAVKTLSNYSNHLFHTPLDAMFAGHEWRAPEAAVLTRGDDR